MKFIPWDANYFDKGTVNKDCVVRALCASTLIGYKTILKLFNKEDEFIMGSGYGYSKGISVDEIDDFAKRTGIIERIWGDHEYSKMLDQLGTTDMDTLESFLENDIDEVIDSHNISRKRFMFLVRTPNSKNSDDPHHYHATSVIFHNNEWTCLDVDTIKQIQYSIPIFIYAVKKMPKKDSPIFYDNERKRILEQRRKEIHDYLVKNRNQSKKY